jgi:hypothetical protein
VRALGAPRACACPQALGAAMKVGRGRRQRAVLITRGACPAWDGRARGPSRERA